MISIVDSVYLLLAAFCVCIFVKVVAKTYQSLRHRASSSYSMVGCWCLILFPSIYPFHIFHFLFYFKPFGVYYCHRFSSDFRLFAAVSRRQTSQILQDVLSLVGVGDRQHRQTAINHAKNHTVAIRGALYGTQIGRNPVVGNHLSVLGAKNPQRFSSAAVRLG